MSIFSNLFGNNSDSDNSDNSDKKEKKFSFIGIKQIIIERKLKKVAEKMSEESALSADVEKELGEIITKMTESEETKAVIDIASKFLAGGILAVESEIPEHLRGRFSQEEIRDISEVFLENGVSYINTVFAVAKLPQVKSLLSDLVETGMALSVMFQPDVEGAIEEIVKSSEEENEETSSEE